MQVRALGLDMFGSNGHGGDKVTREIGMAEAIMVPRSGGDQLKRQRPYVGE